MPRKKKVEEPVAEEVLAPAALDPVPVDQVTMVAVETVDATGRHTILVPKHE